MSKIETLYAYEILDSRGRPTVAAVCELSNGVRARAHVPSGASTGRHEAVELRDGDPARYNGKGVQKAVANVNQLIARELKGCEADRQQQIDRRMIEMDGTPDKSKLGANAILAVSCVVARAAAKNARVPLWRYLAAHDGNSRTPKMPLPMVNILSGGMHAGHNIEFQDFMIVPSGIGSYDEQLEAAVAIHWMCREVLEARGCQLTGVADEGGWGPRLPNNQEAVEVVLTAIGDAGFTSGAEINLAIDVAASHFYRHGPYVLTSENRILNSGQMTSMLDEWCEKYPITSIEDPLHEDDWDGWRQLTAKLGDKVQVIGDDLFTTNLERLEEGIRTKAANSVLVKMNQIGTITETFDVIDRAAKAGFKAIISARSGETEDNFLADLAVASGAGQIKIGSVTRSERLAKYNRLLEIEHELQDAPAPAKK